MFLWLPPESLLCTGMETKHPNMAPRVLHGPALPLPSFILGTLLVALGGLVGTLFHFGEHGKLFLSKSLSPFLHSDGVLAG